MSTLELTRLSELHLRPFAQGCIISYWKFPHPAFARLLADPRALGVFADLGSESPRAWSGFLISKPAHAPPLYWHQDGVLWDHPISYTGRPQQYFLMYSTPPATTAACG